jgi:hypothetical protein
MERLHPCVPPCSVLDAMERQEGRQPEPGGQPQPLLVDGRAVLVSLTSSGIQWTPATAAQQCLSSLSPTSMDTGACVRAC